MASAESKKENTRKNCFTPNVAEAAAASVRRVSHQTCPQTTTSLNLLWEDRLPEKFSTYLQKEEMFNTDFSTTPETILVRQVTPDAEDLDELQQIYDLLEDDDDTLLNHEETYRDAVDQGMPPLLFSALK
jgi:hypothetical protein